MSAHELTVIWPCFFEARSKLNKLLAKLEGSDDPDTFDRNYVAGSPTFGGGS